MYERKLDECVRHQLQVPDTRGAGGAGGTGGTGGTAAVAATQTGDVLGATRAPKTSDSAKVILWMLVMGSSAIGAAAALASKRKDA